MLSAASVLVCALSLLGRSTHNAPDVVLLAVAPAGVSTNAEAFVRRGTPTIFVLTTTHTFRHAQRGDRDALKKLASIIVHEEWHILHGGDERGAYEAQLTTLAANGSGEGTPLYSSVRRSMLFVLDRERRVRPDAVLARTADAPRP